MKDDSLSDVNRDTAKRYGVSKEFADKLDREFDKHFAPERVKLSDSVGKQENVYAKQIWNDAIEAAAKLAYNTASATEIRKLKK